MHPVRTASALALLLLGACSRPPLGTDMPAAFVEAVAPCLVHTGDVRDHCAVTVAAQLDMTGAEWMQLCEQTGRGTAHDLCIERAAWAEREPASYEVCTRIDEDRTRKSCLLGATNHIVEGPIAPLVEVCKRTEDLEADCWVHITSQRRRYWMEKGQAALVADIREAVTLRPSLSSVVPFASEAGRAQARMPVPPDGAVCEAFDPEVPRMTCLRNASGFGGH